MSIAGILAGWWAGDTKQAEAPIVERPVVLWEPDGSEEWTVEGTVQLLIANGADEEEIREFRRTCQPR